MEFGGNEADHVRRRSEIPDEGAAGKADGPENTKRQSRIERLHGFSMREPGAYSRANTLRDFGNRLSRRPAPPHRSHAGRADSQIKRKTDAGNRQGNSGVGKQPNDFGAEIRNFQDPRSADSER